MPKRNRILSEGQRSAAIHQLAVLDFQMAPMETIKEALDLSPGLIKAYRVLKEYREALDEVKEQWTKRMIETPATNQLRKEISWAMSVAVKKVLNILSNPKTVNRDLIAAARLTALLDGRFLSTGDADRAESMDNETVATELVEAINRVRGTAKEKEPGPIQ